MWTDVLDLNEFYGTTLGQMTVRLLRARLRDVWPNVRGETLMGLGYATPFLRPFCEAIGQGQSVETVVVNWSPAPAPHPIPEAAAKVAS